MKQKKEILDLLNSAKIEEAVLLEEGNKSDIPESKKVVVRPIGYPLRVVGEGKSPELTTDDKELFTTYAADQWNGTSVKKGTFLFDQYMYPDFAFKVIKCEPKIGRITNKTNITLEKSSIFIIKKISKIKFENIIGQNKAKEKCSIIRKYLLSPEKFGEWAPRNILFYGPPGTGKTMTALALANETKASIFLIKATDLIGSHVGGGARRIHQLYYKAIELAPSIIFIDELDAIGLDRSFQSIRGDVSEIVNSLLSELDGINPNSGVVTIGSTNATTMLDAALRSRFEEEIEFDLPDSKEITEIINSYSKTLPIPIEIDSEKVGLLLKGFSGRDIKEKLLKVLLHRAILKNKKKIDSKMVMDHITRITKNKNSNNQKSLYL